MSGPTAAVQQSGDVPGSKGAPPPPTSCNDSKQSEARDVCSNPGAGSASKGAVDDSRPSTSPSSKVETLEKRVANTANNCNGSGPADKKPAHPSAQRTGASVNDTKGGDTVHQALAKKENNEHTDRLTAELIGHFAGKNDQIIILTVPKNAPAGTLNAHMTTRTVAAKDIVDASFQEPEKGGESSPSKAPSSPSKKKKKKKKKKKGKASNPESDLAHTQPAAELPDESIKQNADSQEVLNKKSEQGQHAPKEEKGHCSSDHPAVQPARSKSPSKSTKFAPNAKKDEQPTPVTKEKSNEKSDKSNGASNGQAEKSFPKPSTNETPKTRSPERNHAKSGTKEKSTSKQSEPSVAPTSKKDSAPHEKHAGGDADDGAWETVEVKPRGRRGKGGSKKSPGAQNKASGNNGNSNTGNNSGRNQGDHGANQHDNSSHHGSHHGRRRHKRHNKKNNVQQQNTKMAKEMISQILDAVDDEVVRRGAVGDEDNGKQINAKSVDDNKRRSVPTNGQRQAPSSASNKQPGQQNQAGQRERQSSDATAPSLTRPRVESMVSNSSAKSLRDVLVGSSSAATSSQDNAKGGGNQGGKPEAPAMGAWASKVKPGISYKSAIEPDKKPEPKQDAKPQLPKPKVNAWAKKPDIRASPEMKTNPEQEPAAKSAAQRSDGLVALTTDKVAEEATPATGENKDKAAAIGKGELRSVAEDTKEEGEGGSASPPLSTLLATAAQLGPAAQFSCSPSSSVASSLEAPHTSRFRHQTSSMGGGDDDVGYHLLNVCGQLSEDINAFMNRRALALDVRRRERSAVLNALGDTLGKIWPNQCRVEKYGSCATALDLPSSDLDLVVCGLDDVVVDHTLPVGAADQMSGMSSLQNSSSLHASDQNTSTSSFLQQSDEGGEVAPGSVSSAQHSSMQQQPMPDQQLGDSFSAPAHEGDQHASTPEQLVRHVSEGDQSAGMMDESAEDYSSGMVENYSPEHETSQQGEMAAGMEHPYSPGVHSYHSYQQQDMAADPGSYHTPGSYHNEMGMAEGPYQEYQTNGNEQFYYAPYYAVPTLSLNAQRVIRLASELELQPWAVQVKAIPTATVPVVKMLADPSRLPGLAGEGGSWMQMQQHLAAQATAGVVANTPPPPLTSEQMASVVPNQADPSAVSTAAALMAQCWRGTDIKNGLQPVDITFEGPEHGGIGSTTYSARVVQEACDETGLPAESTPVVQVASVLKELLAQRRLNEPFSGGLSSYGLLLLLLAVLKDRKIIQEEMKKVERQRQRVTNQDNSGKEAGKPLQPDSGRQKTSNPAPNAAQIASTVSPGIDSTDKGSVAQSSVASKPTVSSSWASIAKKSGGATARTESLSTVTKSTNGSSTTLTAKGGVNYSQVVQKESKDKKGNDEQERKDSAKQAASGDVKSSEAGERSATGKKSMLPQSSNVALDGPAVLSQVTPCSEDDVAGKRQPGASPVTQSGSNDVLEVLCSGELTSGKLLMHFLLFYGQHFDAQSTLIDINGTHHPHYGQIEFDRLSPFIQRPPGGTIDPITGMYSVDPIVVYDPLEGAGDHNVSKRCYCWNNVRWVFAQAYMTLSSIVETSDGCGAKPLHKKDHHAHGDASGKSRHDKSGSSKPTQEASPAASSTVRQRGLSVEDTGANAEVVTPILELFLSF